MLFVGFAVLGRVERVIRDCSLVCFCRGATGRVAESRDILPLAYYTTCYYYRFLYL